jgi:hypothetical protein
LRALSQWLVWEARPNPNGEGFTKVPLCAAGRAGSTTKRGTWRPFSAALAATEGVDRGLGFVFSPDDPYVGVDLDHCLDEDGEVCESWADAVLELLPGAYVERSPSGTGLHCIVRGSLPGGLTGKRRNGVEVYASGRYFTMTGWSSFWAFPPGTTGIAQAPPGALEQILHEFCGWKPSLEEHDVRTQGPASPEGPHPQTTAFEMVADPAPPGKLFTLLEMDAKLKATWDGKRSVDGDDSATEASLAAFLEGYDFKDQEIVDTCRRWRMTHSAKPEKAKERRIYGYLLALVKRDAVEAAGLAKLESLGTPGAAPLTGAARQAETMTALNEVLGLPPEAGVEGLWRFPGDPPTYAIKAAGKKPRTLGTSQALATCVPLFNAFRDLFGIHKKGIKANKWAPVCQALLDAVVEMEVEGSDPEEALAAYLENYLHEHAPVGKEDREAWDAAHDEGAPLLMDHGVGVNLPHAFERAPEYFRREWRGPTRMGRVLAGLGLRSGRLRVREKKRSYWEIPPQTLGTLSEQTQLPTG